MSLIQPNYQVKADNSYSVLIRDNGKEEGAEVTPIDISSESSETGLMLRIIMSLLERE